MTVRHRRGAPVSAATYSAGCRCPGCRAASTERQRKSRARGGRSRLSIRAHSRANSRAVAWVRAEHPDVWRGILDQATAELEREHPDLAVDRRSNTTN